MNIVQKVTKAVVRAPFDVLKGAWKGFEEGLGTAEPKKERRP